MADHTPILFRLEENAPKSVKEKRKAALKRTPQTAEMQQESPLAGFGHYALADEHGQHRWEHPGDTSDDERATPDANVSTGPDSSTKKTPTYEETEALLAKQKKRQARMLGPARRMRKRMKAVVHHPAPSSGAGHSSLRLRL